MSFTYTHQPFPKLAGLEGFHAYQNGLVFYRLVVKGLQNKPQGHIEQQLLRASESVVLNVAEAHPATGADRARRFRIAANEASECWAALDLLSIRGTLSTATLLELRQVLQRQHAMLWKLSRPRPL